MESIGPSIEVSVPSAVTDTPKKASDLNADADDRSNTLLALGKKPDPKLGQWKLNKNQLKKLGIESSVLNALTKLKGNKKSNEVVSKPFDATAKPITGHAADHITLNQIPTPKMASQIFHITAANSKNKINTPKKPSATDLKPNNPSPPNPVANELQRRINSNFEQRIIAKSNPQAPKVETPSKSVSIIKVKTSNPKPPPISDELVRVKGLLNTKLLQRASAKLQAEAGQIATNQKIRIVGEEPKHAVERNVMTAKVQAAKPKTKWTSSATTQVETAANIIQNHLNPDVGTIQSATKTKVIALRKLTKVTSSPTKNRPQMLGFGELDSLQSQQALQQFSDYQSDIEQGASIETKTESPVKLQKTPPRSQRSDHHLKPPVGSAKKALPAPVSDPDEADDEVSDVDARKNSFADTTLLPSPAKLSHVEPKSTRFRRIKSIPVAVLNRRPNALSSPAKSESLPNVMPPQSKATSSRSLVHNLQMGANLQASDVDPTHHHFHPPRDKGLDRVSNATRSYTTTDDDSEPINQAARPQRPRRVARNRPSTITVQPDKSDDMSESVVDYIVDGLEERCSSLLNTVSNCFAMQKAINMNAPIRNATFAGSESTKITNSPEENQATSSQIQPEPSPSKSVRTSVPFARRRVTPNIWKIVPNRKTTLSKEESAKAKFNPEKTTSHSSTITTAETIESDEVPKELHRKADNDQDLHCPLVNIDCVNIDSAMIPMSPPMTRISENSYVPDDKKGAVLTKPVSDKIPAMSSSQDALTPNPSSKLPANHLEPLGVKIIGSLPGTVSVSKKKLSTEERTELWQSLKTMMPGMSKILKTASKSLARKSNTPSVVELNAHCPNQMAVETKSVLNPNETVVEGKRSENEKLLESTKINACQTKDTQDGDKVHIIQNKLLMQNESFVLKKHEDTGKVIVTISETAQTVGDSVINLNEVVQDECHSIMSIVVQPKNNVPSIESIEPINDTDYVDRHDQLSVIINDTIIDEHNSKNTNNIPPVSEIPQKHSPDFLGFPMQTEAKQRISHSIRKSPKKAKIDALYLENRTHVMDDANNKTQFNTKLPANDSSVINSSQTSVENDDTIKSTIETVNNLMDTTLASVDSSSKYDNIDGISPSNASASLNETVSSLLPSDTMSALPTTADLAHQTSTPTQQTPKTNALHESLAAFLHSNVAKETNDTSSNQQLAMSLINMLADHVDRPILQKCILELNRKLFDGSDESNQSEDDRPDDTIAMVNDDLDGSFVASENDQDDQDRLITHTAEDANNSDSIKSKDGQKEHDDDDGIDETCEDGTVSNDVITTVNAFIDIATENVPEEQILNKDELDLADCRKCKDDHEKHVTLLIQNQNIDESSNKVVSEVPESDLASNCDIHNTIVASKGSTSSKRKRSHQSRKKSTKQKVRKPNEIETSIMVTINASESSIIDQMPDKSQDNAPHPKVTSIITTQSPCRQLRSNDSPLQSNTKATNKMEHSTEDTIMPTRQSRSRNPIVEPPNSVADSETEAPLSVAEETIVSRRTSRSKKSLVVPNTSRRKSPLNNSDDALHLILPNNVTSAIDDADNVSVVIENCLTASHQRDQHPATEPAVKPPAVSDIIIDKEYTTNTHLDPVLITPKNRGRTRNVMDKTPTSTMAISTSKTTPKRNRTISDFFTKTVGLSNSDATPTIEDAVQPSLERDPTPEPLPKISRTTGRKPKAPIVTASPKTTEPLNPIDCSTPNSNFDRRSRRSTKSTYKEDDLSSSTISSRPTSPFATPTHSDHDSSMHSSLSTNMPKKRGRPRLHPSTTDAYTPSAKRPNVSKTHKDLPAILTCGNCKEPVDKDKWKLHVMTHYGIAWMEDIEEPIAMEPIQRVGNRIQAYMKANNLKALKCQKCGCEKKSGLGYLSHIEMCGITADEMDAKLVQCEFCPSKFRKVSRAAHNAFCAGLHPKKAVREGSDSDDEAECRKVEAIRFSNSGRVVRKSAAKAKTHLHKTMSTDNDPFEDSGSDAKIDDESSESDGTSGDPSNDDEVESDEDEPQQLRASKEPRRVVHKKSTQMTIKANKGVKMIQSHFKRLESAHIINKYYPIAHKMTHTFQSHHYSSAALFPCITTSDVPHVITDPNQASTYHPTIDRSPPFGESLVSAYSNSFGTESTKEWQRIGRFESTAAKARHSFVLFCGGPIRTLDWVPQAVGAPHQYLAISCRTNATENPYIHHDVPSKTCLQIWRQHTAEGTMRLQYNVALDDGPVRCVAFCPSGGSDEASRRLAIAAVPTISGNVQLLALPDEKSNIPEGATLRIMPSIVLQASHKCGQITRIVWSKTRGHSLIVAAYVSGVVIMWNLSAMGNAMFENVVDGVRTLGYVNMISASALAVTQLDLHHDDDGRDRWLVTGSLDRRVKFFDLQRLPSDMSSTLTKSRCAAGVWPLNWGVFVCATDETFCQGQSGCMTIEPIGLSGHPPFMNSVSGNVMDMQFNDWLNAYLVVSDCGDIRVTVCQQMICTSVIEAKGARAIKPLGFTDLVPIENDNTEADQTYNTEVGIVFCDLKHPLRKIKKTKYNREPHIDQKAMCAVNRVAFNPNENACRWYAVGYNAGFVRVKMLNLFK